jgi:hypothetical protein
MSIGRRIAVETRRGREKVEGYWMVVAIVATAIVENSEIVRSRNYDGMMRIGGAAKA